MSSTLLIVIISLQVIILLWILLRKQKDPNTEKVKLRTDDIAQSLSRLENNLKEDFRVNRDESNKLSKENRDELNNTLKDFKLELSATLSNITDQNQKALEKLNTTLEEKVTALIEKTEVSSKTSREELARNLKEFSEANTAQLEKINVQVQDKLKELTEQAKTDNNHMRESLVKAFKDFQTAFDTNVKSFNDLQREKFGQLDEKQTKLVEATEKKLEEMRIMVDEKLQKTLNERLGQSFELVGKQLESVQKGLGEMQTLAQDVGGLKKVLSNVKMRGGIGEVQLGMLLEQVLAPEQYQANVKTKYSSNDLVEFAIKLPGRDDDNGQVWLPVDAKFPKDVYEQLQTAYDVGDLVQIELAQKNLENTIRKMAKDIRDKYLDPPNTTDFGIMFLPFEGIYAEVVRKASLLDDLQRNYKIMVTGPTTLAAILNSLQMGFRTLVIQKRSSEVWKILGAVKKEFENFGGMLEKAQKNIQTASNQIDEVMGKRTRAIQRKLKGVEVLDEAETQLMLPEASSLEILDEDESV
ncbi:MAG: DNA recombination protein RmuC [Flavobacteriales bacterium]|nr:DNA recombination protein RmuC [Flavobacteriales bacterium]